MPKLLDSFPKAYSDANVLLKAVQVWKQAGERIVFTNGCFDLLHIGHIAYLKEARSLGDRLIIGVNSDASVQRLKGKHRPIKDQENRLAILSSLEMVDACLLFEEDTPYRIIQLIQPDILVKGGDWKVSEIVGSDIVLKNGGSVQSLKFLDGYSTTKLEEKIKSHNDF